MKKIDHKTAFGVVRDLLLEGREVTIRVEGRSMLPFFRSGSRIRLRPIRPEDLRRGQVVFGETDFGNFVVHRILRVGDRRIILQGDGNPVGMECILRERLYGSVACSVPHLLLARLWMRMGRLRKYPLRLLKKFDRHNRPTQNNNVF